MLKALFRAQIRRFERQWNYDAGYMHDLLDAGTGTFFRFSFVPALGHSKDAPAAAMAAAGIAGTLAEDCGPCTQISVDIATANRVKPDVLRAILAGDEAAMGEEAALGYRFARAVLDRDLERSDAARDEIVRRWGRKAVVALSLCLTTARMYPTLKYGLGHGKTCSRVVVAGEAAPFNRPELLAA
ncbi:MAG: hypothetical protein ACOY4K_07510 [Pseudomonadota bacterium]